MRLEGSRQSRPALPLDRELGPKFVIGHHHSGRWCGETDRCVDGWVVDNLTELRGRIGWRREPAHYHAYRAVITLARNFIAGLGQHLNRRAVRNRGRRSTPGECDLGVLRHQIIAEGRILEGLGASSGGTDT